MQSLTLWLVRHGQTDWNLEGKFQGQTDQPLNSNGLSQAKKVAGFFIGKNIAAIYSSHLKRALQTARFISDVLQIPVQKDTRLQEINQGILEGQTFTVIKEKYPEVFLGRKIDPLHNHPPGGESLWQVAQRVTKAVNEIATKHPGKEVVIVSHGIALATLIVRCRSVSLSSAYEYIPDNAQPIKLEWRPLDPQMER